MKQDVTIFDYLKDITVTKRGDLPLDGYLPFLVNRWLAFINPSVCEAINQFNSNVLLSDKEIHYKAMISFFPKMKYAPYVKYIKKPKEEETEEEIKHVGLMAQMLEISQREVRMMLESSLGNSQK